MRLTLLLIGLISSLVLWQGDFAMPEVAPPQPLAGKATPAAPNPLTKVRRLAEPGRLGESSLCNFSSGAMRLLRWGTGLGLHDVRAGPCP